MIMTTIMTARLMSNIKTYFERKYFYNNRKIPNYQFNEYKNKYEVVDTSKAKDYLDNWWSGETCIYNSMLLKIEHMFLKLKKEGHEADWYLDSSSVIKYGAHNDKLFSIPRVFLDENFKFRDEVFICNDRVDNEISSSGLRHWFFRLNEEKGIYELVYKIDKSVDLKKPKYYRFNSETMKSEPIMTENVTKEICFINGVTLDTKDIYNYDYIERVFKVASHEILKLSGNEINVLNEIISSAQSINLNIYDTKVFSKALLKHSRGNKVTLKQLLHLRHLIKKAMKIDSYDFDPTNDIRWKYDWRQLSQEDKTKALEITNKEWIKARKDAFRAVADFMAENGFNWWD